MPQKLAASQYTSTVLLGIAGQSERGKYAAHCRNCLGRLASTKLFARLPQVRGAHARQCEYERLTNNVTIQLRQRQARRNLPDQVRLPTARTDAKYYHVVYG